MNRNLSFLIKPASADCNLYCDYCFYRKTAATYAETPVHRMGLDTLGTLARKAYEYSPQAAGYAFQGGEPMLMGIDFYERALEIQEEYRKAGQIVSNTIQTNAILIDDRWAKFFADHQFLVGVSLDGPQELHDLHRFTRKGDSVHGLVMDACRRLETHGAEFNILTVVNNDTVHHPDEIYRFLVENGFHYLQFISCLEADDGVVAPFSVEPETYGRFLCRLFDEWFRDGYPYVSIRLFDNLLQHRVGQIPECCMYREECGGYLVVEYNGDLYPCDFFVTGDWLLGNITRDDIGRVAESEKFKEFTTLRQRPRAECAACPELKFCHRGCVKSRFLPGMDYSALDYLCRSYKMFFDYTRERYDFLAWDIVRRHRGEPAPAIPGRNDPCFCGSGRKYKKCCEPFGYILKK
ncbi:MAG: anaerobic sulfatase maturase [Candidatus Latescibacterota bacterium]